MIQSITDRFYNCLASFPGSPPPRAQFTYALNAYVNCARGGGEPGNEANNCPLACTYNSQNILIRDHTPNFKIGNGTYVATTCGSVQSAPSQQMV